MRSDIANTKKRLRNSPGNLSRPPGGLPFLSAMVLLISVQSVSAKDKKQPEPGFEKGVFTKITVHIGRLVKLNWKDKTLQLDRENWTKDFKGKTENEAIKILEPEIMKTYPRGGTYVTGLAKRIFRSFPFEGAFIRLRIGSGRLRSANSGGIANNRHNDFKTILLRGRLEYNRTGAFKVILEEIQPPHRTLVFSDEGKGTLVIVLTDNSVKLSLEVKQSKEGNFYVNHVVGDKTFTAGEKTFQAFYAKHRRYVEERLFPLLKHVGMGLPMTPCSAEVKKATLAQLGNLPTPEKISQGQKLIEQLNDNSYKKRQEASKALAADFYLYRDLIARTIRQPSIPPEVLSRLKMIVKSKPRQRAVEEFVIDQGLVSDVGYLIRLLGEAAATDRAVVAKALQRLTKQKFGPDPDAWRKWWSKKQAGKSTTKTGKLK